MNPGGLSPQQALRVQALQDCFREIGRTRMDGVPLLHCELQVQAVDFACVRHEVTDVLQGVLITPWFMNLVQLPVQACADRQRVGLSQRHAVGSAEFAFIGAYEPSLGAFEACSLFSPMFEFADQAAALKTAQEVLGQLRLPAAVVAAPEVRAVSPAAVPDPGRRGFLFGRRAAQASP